MIYFSLFIRFFIIGIGAYGGGMVTIPLIYKEIVTVQGWLTGYEMKELITLAQMTPGPIAVNAATYIGFRMGGIGGSITATLAVISPSILIFLFLFFIYNSNFFKKHILSKIDIKRFKRSLKPGILALLLYAVWTFGKNAISSWFLAVLAAASLVLIFFLRKINPIFVIFLAGIAGIFIYA